MGGLFQDFRYGLRMLAKNPGLTAMAVVTLAFGIGANTTVFSAVNSVLLRRLPYHEPDHLVWITQLIPRHNNTLVWDSDFLTWRSQNHVFEAMAAYGTTDLTLTGTGFPERIHVGRVTASFLSVVGVAPTVGRNLLSEEDRPGRPHVCILSHKLWQRRFGGDPSIVGKAITLNGAPYTVLGILPGRFEFVEHAQPELYVPLCLRETNGAVPGEMHFTVSVIARLKPGVTLDRSQSDLSLLNKSLQNGYKGEYARMMAGARPQVMFLQDRLVGNVRPTLLILFGAVAFVLLIVCVNVADLQLARAVARQREIAIRTAPGAGHWRLARQLFVESLLLALMGAAAGVGLAIWGVSIVSRLGPENIPHLADIRIDNRAVLFTVLVAIATGILFGFVPVLASNRIDPNAFIRGDGSRVALGPSRVRLRGALMVAELALALVLVTGAGLLVRSFARLMEIDLGFNPHNLLTAQVWLPDDQYPNAERQRAFYQELLQRIRALPGVSSADAVTALPLKGFLMIAPFDIAGGSPTVNMTAAVNIVSSGYFHTVGVPLISGRGFAEQDLPNAPKVVIINQTCVRRYFPAGSPIGERIHLPEMEWATIVGVVGDLRQGGLVASPEPEVFVPFLQAPYGSMAIVARSTGDPLSLLPALRAEVEFLDKDLPAFEVATMDQLLSQEVASQRFNLALMGMLGALAFALAVVGIYSVMAYSVAQRTHEFGIRLSLGAKPADVLKLVLGQSAVLIGVGLGIGIMGALALTRIMSGLLYSVLPTDALTFATVSIIMASAALLASYIPARRATKVDPMVALRYE